MIFTTGFLKNCFLLNFPSLFLLSDSVLSTYLLSAYFNDQAYAQGTNEKTDKLPMKLPSLTLTTFGLIDDPGLKIYRLSLGIKSD